MDEESMMNAAETSTALPQAASSSTTTSDPASRPEGMSKSAMKKAARQARMEELKPLKRAAEKERRKIRQAQLSEGYAKGTLSEADKEIFERRKQVEKERRIAKRKLDSGVKGNDWMGGVVIDLGFDELMNDQEINSTASQLGYVYSSNRTAKRPIHTVMHTTFSPSASPRLWKKLSPYQWDKWSRSYWWSEGLGELHTALKSASTSTSALTSAEAGPSTSTPSGSAAATEAVTALPEEQEGAESTSAGEAGRVEGAGAESEQDLSKHLTGPNLPQGIAGGSHKLVYLSADAEEELSTLSEDEVYIIGGIVDRNRYKNLCQDKAEKLGIRTARLPIGTFIANLPTRKVLTVNQVFDILVQYLALGDWKNAFEAVIPQRKYHESKRAKKAHLLSSGTTGGDLNTNTSTNEEGAEVDQDEDDVMDASDEEGGRNAGLLEEGTGSQRQGQGPGQGQAVDEEDMMNQ